MRRLMNKWFVFSALLMSCAAPVMSQSGDILIGMSLPLSGFNAAAGQEGLTAAKAAIAMVNAEGGIQGRKLSIVALDDEFNPAKAAENAKTLEAQGVVALFNCWGTASCSAMMPVIKEKQLPMVSGIAGGGPMRTEPGRYAFNVRPTTADEIAKMVTQMRTIGQNRIAVIYQDDPFGKSGQVAAQAVFQKASLKAAGEIAIARDGSNAAAAVKQLQQSDANGAIVVASPQATVALISQARKNGVAIQFYNLAAQANRKLITDLGSHTYGVVFTTLVPSPWKTSLPVVRDYQQAIQVATKKDDYSYLGLEVFVNAQVLIEGLKRAGAKVTRDSLVTALETMGEKRFGGVMSIKYGNADRNGSDYVGLTIIGSQGRFVE
jgi:branched-chain amino acid transport system substrate-binding protein